MKHLLRILRFQDGCRGSLCKFSNTTTIEKPKRYERPLIEYGEFVDINGVQYKTDKWTNLGNANLKSTKRKLHQTKFNPLNLLSHRIRNYFYANYKKRSGNPSFAYFDNLNPVVSVWQNFDSLFVPADHISRSRSDTYYINAEYVLRGHTSAHQHELISSGLDHFLVVGDVYRRDEIDRNHFPCFHQMEGVYLFTDNELYKPGHSEEPLTIFEGGNRTDQKQECHTLDCSLILQNHLKTCLEGLVKDLFGSDVQCKWTNTYFPFTHPSFELEVFYQNEWLESLGCGIIEQKLLKSAGAEYKVGWAFGLGLERLAMKLYDIPDIRLFWSRDVRFTDQFTTDDVAKEIKYKPISKFGEIVNDMSMWLPDNKDYTVSDFYDLVRQVGGDLVEKVELFDDFVHPKMKKRSHAFKVTYRHMERTLSQAEITLVHTEIADEAEKQLGVLIRR